MLIGVVLMFLGIHFQNVFEIWLKFVSKLPFQHDWTFLKNWFKIEHLNPLINEIFLIFSLNLWCLHRNLEWNLRPLDLCFNDIQLSWIFTFLECFRYYHRCHSTRRCLYFDTLSGSGGKEILNGVVGTLLCLGIIAVLCVRLLETWRHGYDRLQLDSISKFLIRDFRRKFG